MRCLPLLASAALAFRAALPPTLPSLRARASLVATDLPPLDSLPDTPDPSLNWTAQQTLAAVCLGLQHNDVPTEDAGLVRLYHFLHPRGRVDIAPPPPTSGLQGFVSLEDFLRDAASPALGSLILCSGFKLVGEPTVSPPGPARGALATQTLEVYNEPEASAGGASSSAERTLEALVEAPDEFLQKVIDAVRRGQPPPELPLGSVANEVVIPTRATFLVQMEQERRPPYQGCWLIKEFHNMKRTTFQVLNDGGEEFEGSDSG
ncbi:hypothetical protein AB1Y20_014618 [Prymnesium parvum]|uniref:Uncharacterized protein n=1 Tax=Prymnesium parvum TaxID=97485 RepID=A0AB34IEV4_PRYPA